MGRGIAHVFAVEGYSVTLVDIDQEKIDDAYRAIVQNIERRVDRKELSPADRTAALARLFLSLDVSEVAPQADLVIEAVPEQRTLKREVLSDVDAVAPAEAIIASNTSSISLTWLGAQTARPDRVIGMHFFNPVPVMTLVEVVRGRNTRESVVSTVIDLVETLGKVPVEVKDSPGFVSNRILMPMINEAVYCVMEGVATPEEIDRVMTLGMSHPMGPLKLADFIGLEVCLSIMEVLHRELGEDKYRPCPLLRRMVAAGELGRKSGQGFYAYD
jgi:3-hydroxybutyryl-CoA dehydrogenase